MGRPDRESSREKNRVQPRAFGFASPALLENPGK